MKRPIALIFAALFSMMMTTLAPRLALAGPATDVVRTKQTALFELIQKPPTPDTKKKTGALFDEMLDYAGLAEASLGSEWAPRTDAEKAEFSNILKELVRKAYEKNLKKTVGYDIAYVGEETQGNFIVVKTRATSKTDKREAPIEIDFKMHQRDGAWKVGDIVTEGASLVASYKSQFTRIVKKDGFPTLIRKMKDKLAKGDV